MHYLSLSLSISLLYTSSFCFVFISGEGLSASRHSLRTGLSASNISLKGENRLSLLLNYLLPSSRAGTPAASRCTTPIPTPQNTPPSSPSCSHLATTNSQPSELQGEELLLSPANDDIPTVIIHPPEEDLEVQATKTEDNIDITPGNYPNFICPCVMPSASESLALQYYLAHGLSINDTSLTSTTVCMFCFIS